MTELPWFGGVQRTRSPSPSLMFLFVSRAGKGQISQHPFPDSHTQRAHHFVEQAPPPFQTPQLGTSKDRLGETVQDRNKGGPSTQLLQFARILCLDFPFQND